MASVKVPDQLPSRLVSDLDRVCLLRSRPPGRRQVPVENCVLTTDAQGFTRSLVVGVFTENGASETDAAEEAVERTTAVPPTMANTRKPLRSPNRRSVYGAWHPYASGFRP